MSNRRTLLVRMIALLGLMLGSWAIVPATLAAGNGLAPHCVMNLDPLAPGQIASVVRDYRCFSTFPEAISYATGGTVRLAPDMRPSDLTEEVLRPSRVSANVLIGTQWKLVNYRTDIQAGYGSISYTTTQTAACQGYTYGSPTMASGWNNVVQSAHAYENCSQFRHFDGTNWTGDYITCTPGCPNLGAMNLRTSSWRLGQNL